MQGLGEALGTGTQERWWEGRKGEYRGERKGKGIERGRGTYRGDMVGGV